MNVKADLNEFTRKLKCREKFWNIEYEDESLLKSKSFYNPNNPSQELKEIINVIENTEPIDLFCKDNLTLDERNALLDLNNISDIIIQKADKVNTLVIMDREFYVEKLIKNDHLESNTYQKIDQNSDKKVFTKLNH